MQRIWASKSTQYIFFEMIPAFVIGVVVFIFILLMTQALRLTDFVLVHGVSFITVAEMMTYLSISFLPALFPMALLFAVLMTYGRLSSESEIVAFRASGMDMIAIGTPALLLAIFVAFLSGQTSFHIAPWGNRQFEVLVSKISQTKAGISLREGTFSEGFFDMVIYANNVESEKGGLEKVFIYDERDKDIPLTIIAKRGELIQDSAAPGNAAMLRLEDGDIHRKGESHTKIRFDTFDIRLMDPIQEQVRNKSPQSLTIEEISQRLNAEGEMSPQESRILQTEFHKRWAISLVCLIFGLLGVGLGTVTNRRSGKSSGLVVSLVLIILYWVLYVSLEGAARSGKLPPALAIWTPNFLFLLFAAWSLKKNWN